LDCPFGRIIPILDKTRIGINPASLATKTACIAHLEF
jgi:hypothetical protein